MFGELMIYVCDKCGEETHGYPGLEGAEHKTCEKGEGIWTAAMNEDDDESEG